MHTVCMVVFLLTNCVYVLQVWLWPTLQLPLIPLVLSSMHINYFAANSYTLSIIVATHIVTHKYAHTNTYTYSYTHSVGLRLPWRL